MGRGHCSETAALLIGQLQPSDSVIKKTFLAGITEVQGCRGGKSKQETTGTPIPAECVVQNQGPDWDRGRGGGVGLGCSHSVRGDLCLSSVAWGGQYLGRKTLRLLRVV